MVQETDEVYQVLETTPQQEADDDPMEGEPSANAAESVNDNSANIKTRAFVKYNLSSHEAIRRFDQSLLDLPEDASTRLSVLHFDKFDVLLSEDDPRLPLADNTAQIETGRKLLFNGTKILHFLKMKFPTSSAKLTAQILPPGREGAGIRMAAMGGVAVIVGEQGEGVAVSVGEQGEEEVRRSPRRMGRMKDNGRCEGSS